MKSESPHQNHDDITSAKRPLAPVSPLISQFFSTATNAAVAAAAAAFPPKDRIVPLSFCRSSPLRFYYEVDPDGPALKSPVKPLIRSGKIKPSRWDTFFCSTYQPSDEESIR